MADIRVGITIASANDRLNSLSNQANRSLTPKGNERFRIDITNAIYKKCATYYKVQNNEPDVPQITNANAKQTYLAKLLADIDLALIDAIIKFSHYEYNYGVQRNDD